MVRVHYIAGFENFAGHFWEISNSVFQELPVYHVRFKSWLFALKNILGIVVPLGRGGLCTHFRPDMAPSTIPSPVF
jgi:hypothetical protein